MCCQDGVPDSRIPDERIAWFNTSVFPVLTAAGYDRHSLQLAWDFTTASMNNTVNRALSARDDAMARIAASPPPVTVDRVETFDCTVPGANVAKFVWYDDVIEWRCVCRCMMTSSNGAVCADV